MAAAEARHAASSQAVLVALDELEDALARLRARVQPARRGLSR